MLQKVKKQNRIQTKIENKIQSEQKIIKKM